jgi:hypothetical protein
MNSVLFQPFHLRDLILPNRIVLSPMTRARAARLPNRLMAENYAERSSVGLLITDATTISEEANGWNEAPGIYADEMTEGCKQARRRSLGYQDQRAGHPHAHRQAAAQSPTGAGNLRDSTGHGGLPARRRAEPHRADTWENTVES